MLVTNKLSIKALVLKNLRESTEPFFYLAPDVVGSINNAYPAKSNKLFVVDFNTIDNHNMKLIVPKTTYKNYVATNQEPDADVIKGFLLKFLDGARPHTEQDGTLDEMVDEFGELYDDKDDLPADTRANPGYNQKKNSANGPRQFAAQYTRMISPLGYGGVTW